MEYIIATTARTGSFLLCDLLMRNGYGLPDEHFHPFNGPFALALATGEHTEQHLASIRAKSSKQGIFSTKINSRWLEPMRQNMLAHVLNSAEMLHTLFPTARYLFLTRNDKLRQAVSYYRVLYSQEWARTSSALYSSHTPPLDAVKIHELILMVHEWTQAWRDCFAQAKIVPLQITYESLCDSPEATLQAIAQFVGKPLPQQPILTSQFLRQSDEANEELVRDYLASSLIKNRQVGLS